MDKLKPILAQKFWIFFGIVLILPIVGYFMTKGELAAQITSRWEGLNKTFNDIPSGAGSPNEQWTQGLQVLNDRQKVHNRLANEALWRVQKEKMRWPDDIAAVMNNAEYFKPVPPEKGGSDLPFKYPYDYPREIRRLWEIVDPLDDGKNLRDTNVRRKIAFAMADLHQTNAAKWESLPPTHEEIWAYQEDIWLQTELLQAIARVNANAISQGDSFVKTLGKIQLFGGTKQTADVGAGGQQPGSSAGGADAGGFGGGGVMMGMGGGKKDSAATSADINVMEEFVAEFEQSAGGGMQGAGGFSFGSDAGATVPTTGGALGGKSNVKRYLDDEETQPYKRRGFYIKVVMDHTKVPDLIAELMNSPFPVEIVRVQQVSLLDSAVPPSGGASPFMAGGGGGNTFGAGGLDASNLATTVNDDAAAGALGTSGTSGSSGRSGASGAGSLAAMSDPSLASVAIVGVWTLYRPPAPAPDAGQPAPNTTAPNPNVAAAPAVTTPPATESATTSAKPVAAETTEASGDEPKKPDDGDAPKAEPVKSDKPEAKTEADKPAEKTSPTDEPSEKTKDESK